MEYSTKRRQQMDRAANARHAAYPAAGPVTVTRVDGTTSVEAPKDTRRADQPHAGRPFAKKGRAMT